MASILLLVQSAVLAYALVGGVFLAFSDFIMRSLSQTGGSGGVESMQAINREVFRWVFMALFLGLAVASLGIAAFGWIVVGGRPGTLMMLAGSVYLIGSFGVTVFFNLPMNQALARMSAADHATNTYWNGTYLPRWTFWNTIRTLACVLSAALLLNAVPGLAPTPSW